MSYSDDQAERIADALHRRDFAEADKIRAAARMERQRAAELDTLLENRDALFESLTKAKRLLVDVHKIGSPEVKRLIEARTGTWFVWGVDRSAEQADRSNYINPLDHEQTK